MRKRFAPLAMLFGLLTALMLGSTAMAQATTPVTTFASCANSGTVNLGNVITCIGTVKVNNVVKDVEVKITNNKVLNGIELNILKTDLNLKFLNINILNDVDVSKLLVVTVYNLIFDPDITVGNVNILCTSSHCS